MKSLIMTICLCVLLVAAGSASALPAIQDNGFGTANLPLSTVPYRNIDERLLIIDGLPPGTTIAFDTEMLPLNIISSPPDVSWQVDSFFDVFTELSLDGTGSLAGYHRDITIPSGAASVHWGPRTPGNPVQNISADWNQLQMQIIGDPDFDLLRITGGTNFGLPSPGHTTLTQLAGGNWAVDSFFDITYRIDFVGAPGSLLGGRSGSTTGTIRMAATPEPTTMALLGLGSLVMLRKRKA